MLSPKQASRMEAKAYRREKRKLRAELRADPTNFSKYLRLIGLPYARLYPKVLLRDRPLLSAGGFEIPPPRGATC